MRRTTAFLTAAAAATTAAHAAQPLQFDLTCTKTSGLGAVPAELRIDLEARQFCVDDCTTVEMIEEVTASRILLNTTRGGGTRWRATTAREIDRLTGTYRQTFDMRGLGGGTMITEGTCAAQPFSGFPAVKF